MIHKLKRDRGDSLVMVALSLFVLLALLALAIDVGFAYSERRQMQNAADSGALAGAAVMMKGGTDGEILAAIDDYTHRNTAQTFEATYAPSGQPVGGGSVPNDATGIAVTAVVDFPTFLAFLVGTNTIEANGDATGGFGPLDIVLVLDRSGSMDDNSCDLREAQCPSSDPHDSRQLQSVSGQLGGGTGTCDISPLQLWPGHSCPNLNTQVGCQNCRGVWRNPPMPITEVRVAANTFVDRNNPNLSHLGLVSYSTSGSLNQGLTNNLTAVKNAINGVGTPYPHRLHQRSRRDQEG